MECYLLTAKYLDVLIDSGAFSAYNSGAEISLDEYIEYCHKYYHSNSWQYIQLDKIKQPDVSEKQLHVMVQNKLKPMPVLVAGMDFSNMKDYTEINNHVCVAGGVGTADKYIYYRYQQAFKESNGKAKIHALGFLRFPDLYQLPIYSGDSSTYAVGSMFGSMQKFDERKGIISLISSGGSLLKSPNTFMKNLDHTTHKFLLQCNVDIRDSIIKGTFCNGGFSVTCFITILAYINYSYAAKLANRKVFLAVSDISWLVKILLTTLYRNHTTKCTDVSVVQQHALALTRLLKTDFPLFKQELENVLHQVKNKF